MKKKYISLSCIALMTLFFTSNANARNEVTPLHPFYSTQITTGDMKGMESIDISYIKSLDADRLLYYFRERVGISQPAGAHAYGGWESSDLRGHTLGHYLSALSLLYVQSGDEVAKSRLDYIVNVLGQVQNVTGGYLSAFDESMLDRVESDGSGWAPYYTLHKILQGLLDAHVYGGNEQALTIAGKFGDYIYNRTTRLTDASNWVRVLDIMEVGGFAESMLNLYQLTGKVEHLKGGQFFQQMTKLEPSANGIDQLADNRTSNFHHANSTIPQFIAAEREYELTGDDFMLRSARNFWDNVVEHRSYCNGSTSFWEHWNLAPDRLSQELGVRSGEGCCTYNLIRLSNDLFRMLRNPKYVEYVERASLNHIMGSIHPENGDFMYFHTQYPGSFKTFGKNEECFWCCTGTGMENHLRYGQSVFFGQADTLYVAQFFPSKLDWTEKGLKIEQVSEFPYEEGSRLNIIEGKAKASLKIRIPSWSEGFSVKVNGDDIKWNSENGFCCINRTWKKGDYVEVSFPMHLRLETLADHPRKSAILYGPLVLAGNLGSEGVTKDRVHVTDNYFNGFPDYMNPTTPVPMLTGSMENLDWLTKTEGKMEFTTSATSDGCTLTLLPLYKAVDMRFTDYFEFAGDLSPVALEYPVEKLNAKPVTQLENGVEYAIKNANATLSNTNFYWDGINVRTHSTGSVDDVKVIATSVEEGDETYWTFTISSSAFQNQYLGRTNHANVQATGVKTLWIAEYNESADVQGSGFLLRMKADSAEGGHEMMMNGDATWVVAWVGDHGSDYTPNTSHWQFYRVSDLNQSAMLEYNEVNLTLYKYLVEAQQMYDRGIRSMAEVYNKAIVVYTNPDNTLEQLKAAIEEIRAAIAASVTCYEVGIPATYGIINPGFENLSNQRGVAGNEMKAGPFGWDLKRDGEIVTNPTWWWCSINSDGNMYKEGNYVWGIWDYTYGDIELSQTLTGLANGEWKLSARLMNNHTEANNHARIFLNNSCMLAGNEEDYTWLPDESQHYFLGAWSNADNDMQHQFVLTTTITDGTLYFGVRSNGFFKVDDFRLTYLGDPSNLSFPTQSPLLKSEVIYDLQGRMVGNNFQQLKPGIYITAGKKIVKI